jgi:decaprenyl-phosphate phosphoribosyltransferase
MTSPATTADEVPSPRPAVTPTAGVVPGLIRAARPKQWAKNVLVLAAPGAAGVLTHRDVLTRSLLAFAAFCFVASGSYLLNDVVDRDADRRHPKKQHRPIASGVVPVPVAVIAGATSAAVGIALAFAVGWKFAAVVGVYIAMTAGYNLGLKHIAVIDIAVVASGFIVRAVAGGVAGRVPISQWFLIVASFGSLFVVAGKRYGEFRELGDDRATVRSTLGDYPLSYLRYVWMIASGVAMTAYCLWAFEQQHLTHDGGFPIYELTIVPFVLALLRYALLLETGHGSAPEDVVLGDRTLQVLAVLWLASFGLAVHVGN